MSEKDEIDDNFSYKGIPDNQVCIFYLEETSEYITYINNLMKKKPNFSIREYGFLEDVVDALYESYQSFEEFKEKKHNFTDKNIQKHQRIIFDVLKIGYKSLGYEISEKDEDCFSISNGDYTRYFSYLKIGQGKILKDIKFSVSHGNLQDVTIVENVGIPDEIKNNAIEAAIRSIDHFNEEIETEIYIKMDINNKYPANWECIVNYSSEYPISCEKTCYICFIYQQYNIHLWKDENNSNSNGKTNTHNDKKNNRKTRIQNISNSCLLL